MDNLLPNIIKDIVFDGTVYHLWYLPASIIGACIAWFLVKKVGIKKALIVTVLLYTLGMLGDSYYGISEKIPVLKNLYTNIFQVSDYTRNGIFFAPVFFILGGIAAEKSDKISIKKSMTGFIVSFSLMVVEGILLFKFRLQRHDSMYIMLLPCMFFLFTTLTHWRGKRVKKLRTSALVIYIIHPMIIVVIRMLAKILGLQKLLVDNSLIHFLAVGIASATASLIIVSLYQKLNPVPRKPDKNTDRSWIEIDFNNLKHNVITLQKAMPEDCQLMAVVKAEAYGHNAFEISSYINQMGVRAFAVSTIEEAISLRNYGVQGDILIMGYTCPTRAKELKKYKLTQTLIGYDYAVSLSKEGYKIKSHIKIDTGMNRLGFNADDAENISEIYNTKQLGVCGIYTHLCAPDSQNPDDIKFTHYQIDSFYNLINRLTENAINPGKIHIQSSYGLLNYPELQCNYIRAGIALYGVSSSPNDKTKLQLDLLPVLSLKSQIVLIKKVNNGESVGYGREFVSNKDRTIAIIPIGYADGLPRNLSCGKGSVLIHGEKVPIIGKICMDQLVIDITHVTQSSVGDIVTLIGKDQGQELTTPVIADQSDSISNEILSRMGNRLKVITRN